MSLFGMFRSPNVKKMREKRDTKGLIKLLNHEDVQVRTNAVIALGEIGDVLAVDPLIEVLKSGSIRGSVAEALGKINSKQAVEPLISIAFHHKNFLARVGGRKALQLISWIPGDDIQRSLYLFINRRWQDLAKLGIESIRSLELTLLDISIDERLALAEASREIGDEQITNFLAEPFIDYLRSKDPKRREEGVVLLGRMGGTQTIALLMPMLKDENTSVRTLARKTLEQINPDLRFEVAKKEIHELLVASSRRELEPQEKIFIQERMKVSETLGMNTLFELLNHSSDVVRLRTIQALRLFGGTKVVEALSKTLNDSDLSVRCEAAETLGQLGDKNATEPLLTALKDGNSLVRKVVASALGHLGDKNATRPLLTALKDGDRLVRKAAASALGQLGDKNATEPLLTALKDGNSLVRKVVASALGQLGDKNATEPLLTALKDDDSLVRITAANALGKIGDMRAVEGLRAACSDSALDVQRAALEALDTLGWAPESKGEKTPKQLLDDLLKADLEHKEINSIYRVGNEIKSGREDISLSLSLLLV